MMIKEPVHPDDIINECSYLWDKAYKNAVHSVGITDWSVATFDQKKRVDITQCVLFKAYVSRLNAKEVKE
ncbi:MAG: hypothetical protein CL489_11600 [Acidobacteria bacterium]|nr:hypothetical protein [Acidobacteriota bacterium]|tara:strand:+ start:17 stop:226 length:210 start_codon:yes stop_codon:yes gene_type:complete